jgi:hypothetical protein
VVGAWLPGSVSAAPLYPNWDEGFSPYQSPGVARVGLDFASAIEAF